MESGKPMQAENAGIFTKSGDFRAVQIRTVGISRMASTEESPTFKAETRYH
jgi:hypothetical protein